MTDDIRSNILFVELNSLVDGRPFDGLAAGEFVDMWGTSVEFKQEDLERYVTHTMQGIEMTRSESGELVGLPIDARGHENGDGAGWIVHAELDDSGSKVRLTPKWTEIGQDLISRGIRRFFSASVDILHKTILGGSLTNWPATRDKQGRIQLRPIELSSELKQVEFGGITMDPETNETEVNLESLTDDQRAELRTQVIADLAQNADGDNPEIAEMRDGILAQARAVLETEYQQMKDAIPGMVAEMVSDITRDREVVELSAALTGGKAKGLPVKADRLQAFLGTLNADQYKEAAAIFTETTDSGLMEFAELGHQRELTGQNELDPHTAKQLETWIADGQKLDRFFEINSDVLEDAAHYNLAKFQEMEA